MLAFQYTALYEVIFLRIKVINLKSNVWSGKILELGIFQANRSHRETRSELKFQ